MIKYLLLIVALFFVMACNSNTEIVAETNYEKKDFIINGKISEILGNKVRLVSFYGHRTFTIDSVAVDSLGHFSLNISKDLPPGMYRLLLGKNVRAQFMGGGEQYVDLIFNYEDIDFQTHFEFPFDSMHIINSKENTLFYEYVLKTDENKTKIEILHQSLQLYPRTDDFHAILAKQYFKVVKDEQKYIDNLISKNKGSMLAKIADFNKMSYPDPYLSKDQRTEFLKNNFFGVNDFKDTLLLYSDYIPAKIIRFLMLFRNENFPQEVQEAEFIKAVDVIMSYTAAQEDIYNNVLDYLIDGFERFAMEGVLLHIYDSFVLGNSCFDDEKSASLKERTEAIKRMAKGQPAPDFTISDFTGKSVSLYEIEAEYTLVVFWSTWCNFCTSIMPDLKTLYNETDRSKLEVVAISLDTNKKDWVDYIVKNNFGWINYSSFKAWDCPIVRSYYVFATPSMILLDKNKEILSKPISIRDLRTSL